MKTIFCPNENKVNQYIEKEISFLHEMGIETYDFKDFKKKPWWLLKLKVANLNWYDDINTSNRIEAKLLLIKKLITIILFKFLHIKIIYTLHNKMAHDGKSEKENLILKKFLIKHADIIAILCNQSVNYAKRLIGDNKNISSKFFFVGCPLYTNNAECNNESDVLEFLYYGMVRPYKNIEILIEAWRELNFTNAKLIIVGKPIDSEYGDKIMQASKGINNIELRLEYIPDNDLDNMISHCQVVVSPLNIKSSMNSGTLIKAMCMKKTIIIPSIEMTSDYDTENMFLYSYDSNKEHKLKLMCEMRKVYDIYMLNPDKIRLMGEALYKSVYILNNDEEYKKRYHKMYFGD